MSPVPQKHKAEDARSEARLQQELQKNRTELQLARHGFERSVDGDLVDYFLHQIDALQARHSYLLRLLKKESVTPPS